MTVSTAASRLTVASLVSALNNDPRSAVTQDVDALAKLLLEIIPKVMQGQLVSLRELARIHMQLSHEILRRQLYVSGERIDRLTVITQIAPERFESIPSFQDEAAHHKQIVAASLSTHELKDLYWKGQLTFGGILWIDPGMLLPETS